MRALPIVLLFLMRVSATYGAQTSCVDRDIPVSFSGSDGTSAPLADSLALHGYDGSHAVTIKSIKPAEHVPRLVLLIDSSSSMGTAGTASAVLAERLVSKLPPDTEIGLAFFASDYTPMASLSTARAKLTFALEALKNGQYYAEGRTAIWSAVREAAKMFGPPSVGDAIYLISDGADNRSTPHKAAALEALAGSGIRLFAAVFTAPIGIRSRTIEELDGPGVMKEAVRTTGGSLLFDPDLSQGYPSLDLVGKNAKSTQFAEDLNRQVGLLLNYYRVEITLPEPIRKSHIWRLSIDYNEQSKSGKLLLIYPRLLMPCQ